jgi:Ser-tRNA(Ala) deacylase AlaX
MVGELDALRTRLAMLQHEVKTMEIEMALEVDTTPRYEHMRDRTRFDVDEVANRCMPPTRELAELLTQMTRIGGSHYTEQFAARSLLQAVERLGLQLQARNKYNELEIAQLQLEKGVTAESKEAVRDIMRRKHESSLQMSGDKTAEEEANLVSVRLPPWVRHCHPAPHAELFAHRLCQRPLETRSHSLP